MNEKKENYFYSDIVWEYQCKKAGLLINSNIVFIVIDSDFISY